MELLTRDGRVRPICRACGKLHSRAKCPRRKNERVGESLREQRAFVAACQAVQEDLRRRRNA
jgi:hypothetical protein